MRRIILFSELVPKVMEQLVPLMLPKELHRKRVAYMPAEGETKVKKYTDYWKKLCEENDTQFQYVDNSLTGEAADAEIAKIEEANVLIITGGNTYKLLHYIRRNGMDRGIHKFLEKDEFVCAGFSAGATIMTPKIGASYVVLGQDRKANKPKLKDLTGLGVVDYEIVPHYNDGMKESVDKYAGNSLNEVKRLRNTEYIVMDLQV